MKECNCCFKNVRHIHRCFVNTSCSWKSCNNCINKQLKYKAGNQFTYTCPQCRKESEYHRHSRFCKWVKSNRGALRRILQLQSDYIKYITNKLIQVHLLVSSDTISIVSAPLVIEPPPEIEPIDHSGAEHYEFT